ncbi:MAG: hypothetical protein EOO06_18840, partial [Chitinophagaceae bacterium]
MNPIHEVSFAPDVSESTDRQSISLNNHGKKSKSLEEKAQKKSGTIKLLERAIKHLNWDPAPQACLKEIELTYAQRSCFSSIKASCGFMIVPFFVLFIGTLFWVISFLFFIEAERTNKPYKLLKEEGRGWVIGGTIALSLGFVCAYYTMDIIKKNFQAAEQLELFGDEKDDNVVEDGETEAYMLKLTSLDLPIDVPTYRQLMYSYFIFIDQTYIMKNDEIKA